MPKGAKKRKNERKSKESSDGINAADTHQEVVAEAKLPPVVNKLVKSSSTSTKEDTSINIVKSVDNVAAISELVAKVEELSILPSFTPTVEVITPTVELSEPNQSDLARKQQLENIRHKLQEALFGVEKLLED